MINCMILSHVIFFVFGAAVVAGDAPSGLGVVGHQQAGDRPASPVPEQHEFHEEYVGAGDVEMFLMRVPQSSEDAEEDAQQAKGWSWMEAQQVRWTGMHECQPSDTPRAFASPFLSYCLSFACIRKKAGPHTTCWWVMRMLHCS